ncbi:hypothetical protein GOBAR_DD02050 [Gossypium barbadense]|nr:hypothetical protein GOBAR_DD02050 [Gossypium barbadense]
MSLRSTVGKDNDNGFGSSIGHENVTDFATSVGKDNVNAAINGEKESEAVLDENEIEVGTRMNMKAWLGQMKMKNVKMIKTFQDEHHCSVSFKSKMGIEILIFEILLRVEHRNCARHMFANLSKRKLGKSFKFNFWQIMKSTTEREWKELCVALEKKDKDAYDNLMRKPQKMWTRAFLGTSCKSNLVGNNLCETFDSSIVETRFKSIIKMLEDIRTKMMTRIVKKKDVI